MNFFQRIILVLTDPEGATYDLYNSPQLGDAFLIVSLYAGLSGINSLISALVKTSMVSMGLLALFGAVLIIYLEWALLSIVFHVSAVALGGKGEIPNAIGFVGLAAAPMVLISIASIIITILSATVLTESYDSILQVIRLGVSVIGMAWGWPGVLCYFGLKNAERVESTRAIILTLFVFLGFAAIEVFRSGLVTLG
jgi:hypothetical protein